MDLALTITELEEADREKVFNWLLKRIEKSEATLSKLEEENKRLREAIVLDNKLRALILEHFGGIDWLTPIEKNIVTLARLTDLTKEKVK